MKFLRLLSIVLISILAISCNDNSVKNQGNILYNVEILKKAQEDLRNLPKFKGKEINVFQNVMFYSNRIVIEIQDPDNPQNIDHYIYKDGKWLDPQPVKITGDGDMKDNVTPIKDIDFTIAAKYAKIWSEKAKELKAKKQKIDYVYFYYGVSFQKRSWKGFNIEAERAEYRLSLNLDGSIEEFKKI